MAGSIANASSVDRRYAVVAAEDAGTLLMTCQAKRDERTLERARVRLLVLDCLLELLECEAFRGEQQLSKASGHALRDRGDRVVVPIGVPARSGGHPIPSERHACAEAPAALDRVTPGGDLSFEQQPGPDADAGAARRHRARIANRLRTGTAAYGDAAIPKPAFRAESNGAAISVRRSGPW